MQGASLTLTLRPLAVVAAQVLALFGDTPVPSLRLKAYAPTCKALNDPPYEFVERETSMVAATALQSEQGELRTTTERSPAVVAAHTLLLLEAIFQAHA